jgi:ankyrin repeat protein
MEDIMRAAREGDEEELTRLLNADPLLLEREDDDYGDRPLAWAAFYDRLGVVRLLLARGANIHAAGYEGQTALHLAAEGEAEEVLAFLLDKGAHANSRDEYGRTPLMLACSSNHLGVAKMLVRHTGDQGLQERSDLGWTALHYAAHKGHDEVMRFLLFAGADPTTTDAEGTTPRELAEENHYSEEVREGRARCVALFQVRPLTS